MRSTLVMLLATSAACLTPYCNIPVRIKLWEMTSPTFPLLVVPGITRKRESSSAQRITVVEYEELVRHYRQKHHADDVQIESKSLAGSYEQEPTAAVLVLQRVELVYDHALGVGRPDGRQAVQGSGHVGEDGGASCKQQLLQKSYPNVRNVLIPSSRLTS